MKPKIFIGSVMIHAEGTNPYTYAEESRKSWLDVPLKIPGRYYDIGNARAACLRQFRDTGRLPEGLVAWDDKNKVEITSLDQIDWTHMSDYEGKTKCYIYAADVWCQACGEHLKDSLPKPDKPNEEYTFESDVYGPYDVSTADTPHHCAAGDDCLSPTVIDGQKYGCFLENDLTLAGVEYVAGLHADRPGPVTRFWVEHYSKHGYEFQTRERQEIEWRESQDLKGYPARLLRFSDYVLFVSGVKHDEDSFVWCKIAIYPDSQFDGDKLLNDDPPRYDEWGDDEMTSLDGEPSSILVAAVEAAREFVASTIESLQYEIDSLRAFLQATKKEAEHGPIP